MPLLERSDESKPVRRTLLTGSCMCGRYTLKTPVDQLRDHFGLRDVNVDLSPRYNIAPTQPVAVVPNRAERSLELFHWGLIPSWAKDPAIGSRMINARAETLAEKPSFREAVKRRRCLVVADGFYEWRRDGSTKTPIYIRLRSQAPFAFAGLWETWRSPERGVISSCTIITTRPNALLAAIHNRMPVILPPEQYGVWLDPTSRSPAELTACLVPFPDEQLEAFAVSRLVNSPANDQPECIVPI